MELDTKIARVKQLIEQREVIDAELATLFGLIDQPKRGRPRKDVSHGPPHQQPAPAQ